MAVSWDFGSRFRHATSYELVGAWPAGLSIDASGIVTGTPTTQGVYKNLSVKALDPYGRAAYTNQFSINVNAFGALVPNFNGEMKGVAAGVGGLTTTHTADLYAPDSDGVYRKFGANEAVWSGGRVVKNIAKYSNDIMEWTASAGITKSDFETAVFDGTSGQRIYMDTNDLGSITGDKFIMSVELKGDAGQTVSILIGDGFAWNVGCPITLVTLTSSYVRYTLAMTYTGGRTKLQPTIGDKLPNGANGGGVTGTISIRNCQLERVSGQIDVINPAEFVGPTTTAPVTKTFASTNGNTVSSNVVSEAVGTPLAESPYLQYYPAAQNECTYSNDLTGADWLPQNGAAIALDEVGITGEPNTASTITDSGVANQEARNSNLSGTGSAYSVSTFKWWVKKDTDQTRFPAFYLDIVTDPAQVYQVNTQTGAMTSRTGSLLTTESIDAGDWWVFMFEWDNTTARNILALNVRPADGDVWGSANTGASGTIIHGQLEAHLGKTIAEVRGLGPIFTTTAAVATDETINEVQKENFPAYTNVTKYGEMKMFDTTNGSPNVNMVIAPGGFRWLSWISGGVSKTFRENAIKTGGAGLSMDCVTNAVPSADENIKVGIAGHDATNEGILKVRSTTSFGDSQTYTNWQSTRITTYDPSIGRDGPTQHRNIQMFTDLADFNEAEATLDELLS